MNICNQTFDQERALYNLTDSTVTGCTFAGKADGESVLKECRCIQVDNCSFSLRYPLWHAQNFSINNCTMDELARAPVWYSIEGKLHDSSISAIKAVRECRNMFIDHCTIVSPEFAWKSHGIRCENSIIEGEYIFMDSTEVTVTASRVKGKYSFQYMNNLTIEDCSLDTKDAFWHSKNVTVRNSVVKGEYLGWFSENLTFENCHIIGTQPLCYCKNLTLTDCTMQGCDLSFEYSDVNAKILGNIDSIKNPKSGIIGCDSCSQIIQENPVIECSGTVKINSNR